MKSVFLKSLPIILAICILFTLSACKKDNPVTSPSPSATKTPSPSESPSPSVQTIDKDKTVKNMTVERGSTLEINATLTVTGDLIVKGEIVFGSNGKIVGNVKDGDGNYLAYTFSHLKTYIDKSVMGEKIILMRDIVDGGLTIESGKKCSVDFNGHVYTLNGDLVGEYATKSDGMLVMPNTEITFSNGILKQGVFGARTIIRNYGNVTLDNFTVDGRTVEDANVVAEEGIAHDFGKIVIKNNASVYVDGTKTAIEMRYGSNVAYDGGLELTIEESAGTIAGYIAYEKAARVEVATWQDRAKLNLLGGIYASYPDKTLTEIYAQITS